MPYTGEMRKGRELGFADRKRTYIWMACPDCDKRRWVCYRKRGKGSSYRCQPCSAKRRSGRLSSQWKGGRVMHSQGYIMIKVLPDDFFYPMATQTGYVAEHRLVMARHVKRCLLPWEIVHHKNGIKGDNRLENLQLLPHKRYHLNDTLSKSMLITMQKRIEYLEALLRQYGVPF